MTVLEAELGSSFFRELVASCLSIPMRLIWLESEFYNRSEERRVGKECLE